MDFSSLTLNDLTEEGQVADETAVQHSKSKPVKLRFTKRQFEAFSQACYVFGIISQDPEFNGYVSQALEAKFDKQTIQRTLVNPIVDAPNKQLGSKKTTTTNSENEYNKKETHFVKPIRATTKSKKLYDKVRNSIDTSTLRQNNTDLTCFTDIRVMLTKYISLHNLKTEKGTIIDKFLQGLAKDTMSKHSDDILFDDNTSIIPTGNRKIIMSIANDIKTG